MVDNGYDIQESVLYRKFTDIKEWYQLKSKIPESRGGEYYGDRNINRLQALAWWVMNLTLRGKVIDLNNFKADIIADAIDKSRIYFEYTRDGKGDPIKPKEFSHEKWNQWEDRIYN